MSVGYEVCRPLRGLRCILCYDTQGSAALHPGLYSLRPLRGLARGLSIVSCVNSMLDAGGTPAVPVKSLSEDEVVGR